MATSTYNLSQPTNTDISNWTSGWAQPAIQPINYTQTTGWNYVGSVGGNSAVYMGNNWVLTAAHVGSGGFLLNGAVYPMVPGSVQQVSASVDLLMFQISPAPVLPTLPVRSTDPIVAGVNGSTSSKVAMIGWGAGNGDRQETWGYDTVNAINYYPLTPMGSSYASNAFLTYTKSGNKNPENLYEVVTGDSGGAGFIYNTNTSSWELAGINDVDGTITYSDNTTGGFSGLVQLDTYATTIRNIVAQPLPTDTPTMPQWALIATGCLLFFAANLSLTGALKRAGYQSG